MKKAFHYVYKSYSRQRDLMSAEEFITFCRNLKLLTDILPKKKLIQVFQTLSNIYPALKSKSSLDKLSFRDDDSKNLEGLVIDENLFVEAIVLCAAKIDSSASSNVIDKVCLSTILV